MVRAPFCIPMCAINIILNITSPNTTKYIYDLELYSNVLTKVFDDTTKKFCIKITQNYSDINSYAAKAPVLGRICAIANCVIEVLGHVCINPIQSGLYLKDAVVHFKVRDPRLSLGLVEQAVYRFFCTIPAAVFAAPQCLLQCCASLYDPQHVKPIQQN